LEKEIGDGLKCSGANVVTGLMRRISLCIDFDSILDQHFREIIGLAFDFDIARVADK
jgi:hypothetical protein